MPTFHEGNMWSVFNEVDYFCFTANNVVTKDGRLVMGAGIAKQVRDRFRGIDLELGKAIYHLNKSWGEEDYGIISCKPFNKVIAFQTKRHWKESSLVELIELATCKLKHFADTNPSTSYALNYPGIGLGGLSKSIVEPIIQTLPDNVQIWSYIK